MNDSKTLPKRRNHPGSGRRAAPVFTKGRQIDSKAQEEVQALLGERERRRDHRTSATGGIESNRATIIDLVVDDPYKRRRESGEELEPWKLRTSPGASTTIMPA